MPPLHMLDASQRRHIIDSDISELSGEELPHRRMWESMSVEYRDGFSIVRYTSIKGVLAIS